MKSLSVISIVLFLLISPLVKSEISALNAEMQVLQQACPVRWESLDVMINSEQVQEGGIWADDADFLDWQNYLSSLAQTQGLTGEDIIRMSQDELTVVTECMAQRVKVMLMLGGTPLGESGLTYLNDSDIVAQQTDNTVAEDLVIGTISTYPADSCQQIKQEAPEAKTDFYWVQLASLDLLDTYRVFCEMDHAGGGWMYWGYIGSTADAISLFEQPIAGYDTTRRTAVDTSEFNNVFPLNQFADTEMIMTLDSPDIKYAIKQNKYVRYRYAVDNVAFNNGPLPCQGLNETFEYSKNDENFYDAKIGRCDAEKWYPEKTNGQDLLILKMGNRGVRWGSAINGSNDSWNHDAWIYIR